MATDLNKSVRRANKIVQKNVKRSVKQSKKRAKEARKGLEKSYRKMSFEQKLGVYGALIAVVALASAIFGRASK